MLSEPRESLFFTPITGVANFKPEIFRVFQRAGLRESDVHPEIVSRLELLGQRSHFLHHSFRTESGMRNVLDFLILSWDNQPFGSLCRPPAAGETVLMGFLHDIGKTGPAAGSPDTKCAVADMFAVKFVKGIHQTVGEVVEENYPEDATQRLALLAECGVGASMTMRDFWDLHNVWTYDILKTYPEGVSDAVRYVTGSHHIDRDINLYSIQDFETPYTAANIAGRGSGQLVLQHRMLIAMDKYESALARSTIESAGVLKDVSHKDALVKARLAFSKKLPGDMYLEAVLQAIDTLGASGRLFA